MSAATDLGDGPDGVSIDEHEDVHVEIEQVAEDIVAGDEGGGGAADTSAHSIAHGNAQPRSAAPRRTIILPPQRAILEEFYRSGMTSAAMHLHQLHQSAAERTQLDLNVVKNWIRNRRRPAGTYQQPQMREQQQQQQHLAIPSCVHSAVAVTVPQFSTVPIAVRTPPTLTTITGAPPESKRICLDMPDIAPSSSPVLTTRPNTYITTIPLVVKVRLADSGESDFVEVELEMLSFQALLRACCEELDVSIIEVSKIRKLPNVLIRKDKDVQRLRTGQELEMVLKAPTSLPTTYTINPYAAVNSSHTVQLLNVNPIMTRELDNGGSVGDTLTEIPITTTLT